MKQDNVLILIGVVTILLAALFAFDDNLSELAPVFLLLGLGSFAWLIFRRTWRTPGDQMPTTSPTTSIFSRASSILGITGLSSFGLSGLGLFDSTLEEFALAGLVIGILLLIFALLARIWHGMRAKQVDTTTGRLSIAAILGLVGIIVVVFIAISVVFFTLSGLGIL